MNVGDSGSRRFVRLATALAVLCLGSWVAVTVAPASGGKPIHPEVLACLKQRFGDEFVKKQMQRPANAAWGAVIEECSEAVFGNGRPDPGQGVCPSTADLLRRAFAVGHDHPIPTASEIACNAKKAKRRPLPVAAVVTGIEGDYRNNPVLSRYAMSGKMGAITYRALARLERDGFPMALGAQVNVTLPPTPPSLDPQFIPAEAIRMYQAVLLADKQAGKPVWFNYYFSGPGSGDPRFPRTEAELAAWLKNVVRPRIALFAKAAEEVRAEVLVVHFELEPDVLMNTTEFREFSAARRLEIAQLLVTSGLKIARRHFKGKIVAQRGWQFHAPDAGRLAFWAEVPMERLSYRGYDTVISSFFPSLPSICTPEYAEEYMAVQLERTIALAKRDGVRWGVGEADVLAVGTLDEYGSCGVSDLRAAHDAILEVVLRAVEGARPRPALVWLPAGPAEWFADASLRKRLATRFTAFANTLNTP